RLVHVGFAAPRLGMLPGVWRVEANWERQRYAVDPHAASVQEHRTHGGLSISDWLTANRRYELTVGIDSWNRTRRAVSLGGAFEQRACDDRLSMIAAATSWMPLTGSGRFDSAAARATFRSSTAATGTIAVIGGGPFQIDAGAGIRLKVPGQKGTFRADFGRGIRDSAHALTVGWQP